MVSCFVSGGRVARCASVMVDWVSLVAAMLKMTMLRRRRRMERIVDQLRTVDQVGLSTL